LDSLRGTLTCPKLVEPSMKASRPLAVLVALGLSCGQAADPGVQPDAVRVGIEDQGRTFSLKAGGRLVIALGEESLSVVYRWDLVSYPEQPLDLVSSDEDAGRFEFTVTGEGRGSVRLAGHPRCGRGLTGSEDDVECPVLGAGPGGAPIRLFIIAVQVDES
jgi:hypothetical protein